jgi:hypothetical protein
MMVNVTGRARIVQGSIRHVIHIANLRRTSMTVTMFRKVWATIPGLVVALMLASGCAPEESAPTSAPPSPLPNAQPSRTPAPPVPPDTNPVEPGKTSQVEKDLRKDLGGPVIKPDTAPPVTEPKKQP